MSEDVWLTLRIMYFAAVREALGSSESIQVRAGTTVGQVRELLSRRDLAHAQSLGVERPLRCAVNQVLCDSDTVLADDAEVAFFPPVTGG